MLFDTHTHLNNESYSEAEREALAAEIEASEVKLVMDVGFDEPSSELALLHAKRYPWCYAVIGMHPHDSRLMNEAMLEKFRMMAQNEPRVRAIGEIGLDFHYDLSPRDVQRHWFRMQIRLANELRMPIVVHSRDADQEVFDILKEEGAFSEERKSWFPKRPTPTAPSEFDVMGAGGKVREHRTVSFADCGSDARVDIHCFSGSRELAIEYVKAGASLGVDGPLTYKNNKKTVQAVETVPLEFLMAETDAPYLTPVPFRGKQNKSPYVEHVVRKIAEIKGISYEEAAAATYENGKRFFGL